MIGADSSSIVAMKPSTLIVSVLLIIAVASKTVKRSKRQLQVYYMCNGAVSQYPCNNNNYNPYNNCNNNNCYGVSIPNSFNYPNYNCNSGCNNLNCNQYNGQWMNGQYVAYSTSSNVYSPCASLCCSNNNINSNFVNNGWNNNNNIYLPYGNQNALNNMGNTMFTGTYENGVYLCGGTEPSGGICQANGVCPSGHSCVSGNVCCRCPVGASAGNCQFNADCGAGYYCSPTNYCCPSTVTPGKEFGPCLNGNCPSGFKCGVGNICYPESFIF
ncbi:unnamed protein product [Caenorhabditis bovis]|uniref:Uncharacterized protein n=1 Tax=Caenorhabditis bovis TaxID=2654633 RepID=A0A8S1E7U9_9PELO|nr:unnamed protein product [Caenorhabditis bovis]